MNASATPPREVFPEPRLRKPRVEGIDFNSTEWSRVRREMSSRVAELYKLCARVGITEREADALRGGIRELESWLDLSEEKKHLPSDIYS